MKTAYKKTYHISLKKAIIQCFGMFLALILFVEIPVIFFWGGQDSYPINIWISTPLLLLGLGLHEMLHAVTAAYYSPNGFKDVRIGWHKRFFVAYCSCFADLKVKQFHLVLLTPFIILGIIPIVIGAVTGALSILHLGILLATLSAGDLAVCATSRKENGNYYVQGELREHKIEEKDKSLKTATIDFTVFEK